ncbi:hypothetical protein ANO11243_027650 [Dothideomycetidae sp. 11243]|nr:hypothetical protein ANO11243_027650 [fungal sp. No.11243]
MPSQSPLPHAAIDSAVPADMVDGPAPAPATGDGGQHELENMSPQKPALPIEEDLMGLARLGELRGIQKLFDSGKYNANSADDQGITALHWAAINGHHALCHFLLQSGADPNVRGGDALATPVLWASKKCQLSIVNLLLQHGADPLIADDAGYNLLHCATLDGNVFQLILLLHLPGIPIDVPDTQGHTSLMWAAYKGFPACVDILLRWGASVNARDEMGFTALHWALVRGNLACIHKLVEYGADRSASNNEGKTPSVTAKEMNSSRQWHQALQANGFDNQGNPRSFPLPMIEDKRKFFWRFFYFLPFLTLGLGLLIVSSYPIYIGIPGVIIVSYALQWLALRTFKWAPSSINHMKKTPYFAGLFSASLFWVGVQAFTRILPYTYSDHFLLSLAFTVGFVACTYYYFNTMLCDPGFVPKSDSKGQVKQVIDELVNNDQFDERHFCSTCVIRKPLRSKHCRRCDRCIAREDHHCPWAANCVGINNHRHFVMYMMSLAVSIILIIRLYLLYVEVIPATGNNPQCTILSDALCEAFSKDSFTAVLMIWSALQLTWVTMLFTVQLTQIARALTTYESMRGHRVGPVTAALTTGSTDSTAAVAGAGPSPTPPVPPAPRETGWWATWKRLLGLDTVLATAMYGSRAAERQRQLRSNPYNAGVVRNCADFWFDGNQGGGGLVGKVKGVVVGGRGSSGAGLLAGQVVDYTRLYTLPDGRAMRYRAGGYESVPADEEAV